ncbi:hypothetical protein R1flu_027973 [Riccia fluitans]|uniref:Secreted protein n=1 Tax=Riccia fluitans TaxID=41844 RepID=A0ABD1XKU3_9MARC
MGVFELVAVAVLCSDTELVAVFSLPRYRITHRSYRCLTEMNRTRDDDVLEFSSGFCIGAPVREFSLMVSSACGGRACARAACGLTQTHERWPFAYRFRISSEEP